MGDRALVVFKDPTVEDKDDRYSPVTYLHWGGERVPELLKETKQIMESRGVDINYTPARFIGVCHSEMEGNLSLGTWNLPQGFDKWNKTQLIDYSHGDAGLIVVDINTWKFEQYGGSYELKQIKEETLADKLDNLILKYKDDKKKLIKALAEFKKELTPAVTEPSS